MRVSKGFANHAYALFYVPLGPFPSCLMRLTSHVTPRTTETQQVLYKNSTGIQQEHNILGVVHQVLQDLQHRGTSGAPASGSIAMSAAAWTHQKRRCDACAARPPPGCLIACGAVHGPVREPQGPFQGRGLVEGSCIAYTRPFGDPLRACGLCRGPCSDALPTSLSKPTTTGLSPGFERLILMRIDARMGGNSSTWLRTEKEGSAEWPKKAAHRQNFVDSWIGQKLEISH